MVPNINPSTFEDSLLVSLGHSSYNSSLPPVHDPFGGA